MKTGNINTKLKAKIEAESRSKIRRKGKVKTRLAPSLDEYLKARRDEEDPLLIKISRIIGIDIHLPILALLEFVSLGLLMAVSILNVNLNEDSNFIDFLESWMYALGWSENIYVNCFFLFVIGAIIAWGFNFFKHAPFKFMNEKLKRLLTIFYRFLIPFLFLFLFFNYLPSGSSYAFAWLFFILAFSTIIFGVIAILIKNRGFLIASFIGIFIVTLVNQNDIDELPQLVLFAAVVLLYFEVSDSTIKFSQTHSELIPGRDEHEYKLLNDTSAHYLLILLPVVGLTIIFTFLILNSQQLLAPLLPLDIVNSLEFKSPIFLFLVVILFAVGVMLSKWLFNISIRRIISKK